MAVWTPPTTRVSLELITPAIWNTDVVENLKALHEGKSGLVAAKGDLLVGSAAGLLGRLAGGAEGTVPVARAAAGLGIAWEAAAGGFTKIAETILGADTASVTFSSIPATYRHLELMWTARTTDGAAQSLLCRFNGDTGANYDTERLESSGATTSTIESLGATGMVIGAVSQAAGYGGVGTCYIHDYARATWRKHTRAISGFVMANTTGNIRHDSTFGHWRNAAAITSLTLLPGNAKILGAGSIFSLYGLSQ